MWEVLGALQLIGVGVGALLLIVSGILLVVGRTDTAKSALAMGVVLVLAGGYGPEIVAWLLGGQPPGEPGLGAPAAIIIPVGNVSKNYPVEVAIIPLVPGTQRVSYTVDWGDGSTSTGVLEGGEPIVARHVYGEEGSYTVSVTATVEHDGGQATVSRQGSVNVVSPWRQLAEGFAAAIEEAEEPGGIGGLLVKALKEIGAPLALRFAEVMDAITSLQGDIGLYYGYAFYYYVSLPTADAPGFRSVYATVQQWALTLLPLLLVLGAAWRGFWEFEHGGDAVLALFRDLVAVVFAVLAGLYMYDEAANLWNTITLPLAQLGQLSAVYGMLVSVALLLAGLSVVAPSMGSLLAIILAGMIFVVLGGLLKWLAAYALAASIPLAVVFWLVPPLRFFTRLILRGLVFLFAFTLVAAILSYGLSQIVASRPQHLDDLVFAVASGVIFALAAPTITMGLFGAGPLGGVGRAIASRVQAALQAPATAALAAAGAATGGAVAAAGAGTLAGTTGAAGAGTLAAGTGTPGLAGLAMALPARRIELGPPQPPPGAIERVREPEPVARLRAYWEVAKGEAVREPMTWRDKAIVAFMRHGPPRSLLLFYEGLRQGLKQQLGVAPPSPETIATAAKYTGKAAYHGFRLAYRAGTRAVEIARRARMGDEAGFTA